MGSLRLNCGLHGRLFFWDGAVITKGIGLTFYRLCHPVPQYTSSCQVTRAIGWLVIAQMSAAPVLEECETQPGETVFYPYCKSALELLRARLLAETA